MSAWTVQTLVCFGVVASIATATGWFAGSTAQRTNAWSPHYPKQSEHCPPPPVIQPESRALVSMLIDTDAELYVRGAKVLIKSALRHAPGYFSAMELLVLNGRNYNPDVLQRARAYGWRLRWVDVIMPPHPSDFARFRDQFAKLHLWDMDEFSEVVYMDLDTAFVSALQGSFISQAAYPTACKIWTARDIRASVWQDAFNMGVAGIRPNKTEFQRLYQLMADDRVQYEYTMSEQGFLNAVYTSRNGEWCELEFEKNANLAAYSQQRAYWDASKNIQVVHYTMEKPWACGPEYRAVCDLWDREEASSAAPVTVVSAFFAGPSKHAESEYDAWGRNFLRQRVPLVIFTDNRTSVRGLDDRDPNITRVVELSMSDFTVVRSYFNWDKQLEIDPERSIHNTRVFKVWLEKTAFVMRAIQLDAFQSTHYVWVDFGCFRTQAWAAGNWTAHVERFPTRDRLLMLNVPVFVPGKTVAGTIFGGSVRAWRQWSHQFDAMLSLQVRKGKFAGDDQIVMSLLVAQHPELACAVNATVPVGDPFWYLQYYLAGAVPIDVNCSRRAT